MHYIFAPGILCGNTSWSSHLVCPKGPGCEGNSIAISRHFLQVKSPVGWWHIVFAPVEAITAEESIVVIHVWATQSVSTAMGLAEPRLSPRLPPV
jgi:hypothetical protein